LSQAPVSADAIAGGVTEDAFLGGALTILQPKAGYRAGLDAVLLAAAAPARSGEHLLDVGAGVGVVGLAAARRLAGLQVTLVEQDAQLVALARDNIRRNRLAERASVVVADVMRPLSESPELHAAAGRFDHAVCNPPFLVEGRGSAAGEPMRAAASTMPAAGLERWVQFTAAMVRAGGTVTLIQRADALHDVLAAMDGRFGGARLLPLYPRANSAASRVLVQATKGSRAPLTLLPGIVLHNDDNGFRPEIEAILRHAAALEVVRRG
jgi:tRNA1(Val) A37 N6-methylase TrmN6